jgi:hypothetical protein
MSGHCEARCNLRFSISGSEESFIRDSSTSLHFAQNDKMMLDAIFIKSQTALFVYRQHKSRVLVYRCVTSSHNYAPASLVRGYGAFVHTAL